LIEPGARNYTWSFKGVRFRALGNHYPVRCGFGPSTDRRRTFAAVCGSVVMPFHDIGVEPHELKPGSTGRETSPVDVSIIIPNYNTRDLLRQCLDSIYSAPPESSFEVIVVDDASADGSAAMVRERFPKVRLRANDVNRGYARSNNWAMVNARGRYLYLLNSDAILHPGAVDELVRFLDSHPKAGAAGSLLLNEDGSVQASVKALPSIRSAFVGKRSWLHRLFPRSRLTRQELLHWQGAGSEEPFPAGYVSSASIMIPVDVARKVGDLDMRLWWFIDADYCKRIWDVGCEVWCVPAAKAVHLEHKGGTLAGWKRRVWALKTFHRGAWIYYRKHSGHSLLHPMTPLVALGLGLRFALAVLLQAGREILGLDRRYTPGMGRRGSTRS
jgi:hypothetical protein